MSAEHTPTPNDVPLDWGSVLECHSKWLRAVIHSRLGDWHETDEVMQEVSCAALQSNLRDSEPGTFQAWLYRTALRQAMLFRRREGRQRKRIADSASRLQNENVGPLKWLLCEEATEHLRMELDQLRDNDRLVLILK